MPTITVVPDGVVADLRPGETIVDALRRAGWRTRYKCRRGGCGACRARLVAGEVHYPSPVAESVLSADDRAAGMCLPCQAVPLGDAVMAQTAPGAMRRVLASGRPAAAPQPQSHTEKR